MKMKLAAVLTTVVALGGCAGMGGPRSEDLSKLPLVTFGGSVPADREFILHFPVGQPIPTTVRIEGNLFERPANETMSVKLLKDVYAYKEWVSFDRQHWLKGEDIIGLKVSVRVPGYHHPKPGSIVVELNEKTKPQ
jgi:hypothetical protein